MYPTPVHRLLFDSSSVEGRRALDLSSRFAGATYTTKKPPRRSDVNPTDRLNKRRPLTTIPELVSAHPGFRPPPSCCKLSGHAGYGPSRGTTKSRRVFYAGTRNTGIDIGGI